MLFVGLDIHSTNIAICVLNEADHHFRLRVVSKDQMSDQTLR